MGAFPIITKNNGWSIIDGGKASAHKRLLKETDQDREGVCRGKYITTIVNGKCRCLKDARRKSCKGHGRK